MSEPSVIVTTADQLRALIRQEVEAALGLSGREERLDLQRCADRYGVTRQTIRHWCRTMAMPHRRTGKGYLFVSVELEEWEGVRGVQPQGGGTVHRLRGVR